MKKKTDSLVFKFALIFFLFTLVTAVSSGLHTYLLQTKKYREQCKTNIAHIAEYLASMMQSDAQNFKILQNWWVEHVDEVRIPLDFDGNPQPARHYFETLINERYHGKVFDVDISFYDLDAETQKAWAIWYYEVWLCLFEEARTTFNIPYTYYIFPVGEDNHFFWMIDALREPFENPTPEQEGIIDLTDDYFEHTLDDYPNAKEIWTTARQTHNYDTYDDEYGKNYAYYVPFVVDEEILGLIGVDIEISEVNKEILQTTFKHVGGQTSILVITALLTLLFIYHNYIQKIIHLQDCVRQYTKDKNPAIAEEIQKSVSGKDEIAVLTSQFSTMIIELENYIKNLFKTNEKLKTTEALAKEMNELANTDPLTSLRNKNAYDKEVLRIQEQIQHGHTDFGIVMIDLNFLKKINDTFGHEQGNKAIKRLSRIICSVFAHSPVFRIGGDEFVTILRERDYENRNQLLTEFQRVMDEEKIKAEAHPWHHVSAAVGFARFESGRDRTFQNVFDRADKAMYNCKRKMKALRT